MHLMTDQTTLSDRERFGFAFVTLARRWRRAIDRALAEAGLTDATWTPLIHLSQSGGGISQTELAMRVGLDASSLVRLLDLLSGRGLVERRIDPRDRRARLLHLTPEGETEVARIRRDLQRIETGLLADLDDDTLATMLRGFAQVDARVMQLLTLETAK